MPEAVKHYMESSLVKAGVRIRIIPGLQCVKASQKVTAVIAESPAGREAFKEECSLIALKWNSAALATADLECGDPQTGQPQAAALRSLWEATAEDIADYLRREGEKESGICSRNWKKQAARQATRSQHSSGLLITNTC